MKEIAIVIASVLLAAPAFACDQEKHDKGDKAAAERAQHAFNAKVYGMQASREAALSKKPEQLKSDFEKARAEEFAKAKH